MAYDEWVIAPETRPTLWFWRPADPGAVQAQGGTSSVALINQVVSALRRDEDGQGLAEYALILALIAIVAIIALIFLGTQVSGILSTVGSSV